MPVQDLEEVNRSQSQTHTLSWVWVLQRNRCTLSWTWKIRHESIHLDFGMDRPSEGLLQWGTHLEQLATQVYKLSNPVWWTLSAELVSSCQKFSGTIILQYVHDLLLASEMEMDCKGATEGPLQGWQIFGYRESTRKAQLCASEPTYLGYQLRVGQRSLSESRIATILPIPAPKDRQVREFLGVVRYCHLWIPEFAERAKPPHASTEGGTMPLTWTENERKAFKVLKRTLTLPPALALPDVSKPFLSACPQNRRYCKRNFNPNLGHGNSPWHTCPNAWTLWPQDGPLV